VVSQSLNGARRRALAAALVALSLLLALAVAPPAQAAGQVPSAAAEPGAASWVATWGAAPQSATGAGDCNPCTIRQTVRTTIGGQGLRLVMSNVHGSVPLLVASTSMSLPLPGDDARSVPGSRLPVTFGGQADVTIPAGGYVTSDPVAMTVTPGSELQTSMYFPAASSLTYHRLGARYSSYVWRGADVAAEDAPPAATLADTTLFVVSGIDVLPAPGTPAPAGSVVVFGDSITDGDGATSDPLVHANGRWSDHLASRVALLDPQYRLGVVNAGIAGNKVLGDNGTAGRAALTRFQEDVLDRAGVRSVIILEGINDILQNSPPAQSLIDALTTLANQARAAGITPIGGTLTPYKNMGSGQESIRQAVNAWIRTTDVFDAVADFDAAVRDPDNPAAMRPELQKGDELHPGPLGYAAMGAAIDLADLGAYPRPGDLRLVAADSVARGATAHLTARVTATTAAHDVRVIFTLPEGWSLVDPGDATGVDLGSLAAGQSAVASVAAVASTPEGRTDSHLVATAYLDGRATSANLTVRTRAASTVPDGTPPVTRLSLSPALPPASGWYTQPVTASASASDDGPDLPFVEQRVDGGAWAPYVDPVTLGDGRHTVEARSTDPSQNLSAVVTAHADVDTVAPRVVPRLDRAGRTVSVTVSDATSGVARTEYRTGDGPWLRYRSPVHVGRSAQTVAFRAADVAGNLSGVQRVDVPAASPSTTTAALTPVRHGTAATLRVRVTASDGQVPGGGVVVREGTTILATAVLAQGQASVRLPADLAVGRHAITASYVGSESVDPSAATAGLTVTRAASKVRVTAHRASPTTRVAVAVKVASPGTARGKVKVTVRRGSRPVVARTVRTNARGKATLRLPRLDTGTYRVKARFLGSPTVAKAKGATRLKITR